MKLLFLDDHQINKKIFLLRCPPKFEVFTADNVTTASHLLKEHKFDVIVSDAILSSEDNDLSSSTGLSFVRDCVVEFPDTILVLFSGLIESYRLSEGIHFLPKNEYIDFLLSY
ncbi:hypothetical protein A3715_19020 [Oleiphilus sp. HI0009]|nr:hypothetical protein A3715_19020 [Oleiphilus sp. HI0009]